MKNYTTNDPKFSDSIPITTEDDLINDVNDSAAVKQLIANDLVLKGRMEKCLGKDPAHGDSKDLIATFDSGDAASVDVWTDVAVMQSKEEHKSLFGKISTMIKNVRYLYRLLGTTDISKYGQGTVTGAIKELAEQKIGSIKAGAVETCAAGTNAAVSVDKSGIEATINFKIPKGDTGAPGATGPVGPTGPAGPAGPSKISDSAAITAMGEYALDAREKNAALPGTLAHELAQINSNIIDAGIIFSSADNLDNVYYNSFLIKNLVAFRLHFSISGTLEVNTWYKIGSIDKHFPNGAYPLLITCPQTNAWIAYPIAARIDRSGNLWIAVKEKMWNATVILSGIWFVS